MDWNADELLCNDLPTRPRPQLGIVLVTGATGYIGGRLVPELLARGYRVRIMVRSSSPEHAELWPDAEICVADALNVGDLRTALEGITVAYYLIHSMLLGKKEFEYADIQAVTNFSLIAEEMNLKRIIYLGGLGRYQQNLSSHLKSRLNVAEILTRSKVPCTILSAAIIIGSGSASYEIIKYLVRNWPVYIIPAWTDTLCQPISIRDVVKYLVGVLELEETSGRSFEIGGDDVLSYKEMIRTLAKILRKRRLFLNSPISSIKLYSYFTSLLTPVPAPIIQCLMEGVKNEVICVDSEIKKLIPFKTIGYKVSLLRALLREDHDAIYTP
ncbi:MAG: NAD(P)H-binding protein [Bacteroidales bacterium]